MATVTLKGNKIHTSGSLPETGTKEITIHSRSASRVGTSDFGVNRKRMEQIRDHLIKKIPGNSAAG